MRKILPIILCLATLQVTTDPYEGLDYDEINTYEIENEPLSGCIGYTESEGWGEPDPRPDPEDGQERRNTARDEAQIPWRPYWY